MIRCHECNHSNPDDHRYCGMCGVKLLPVAHAMNIDDDDPLALEAPVYQFEDQSSLSRPAEVGRRDRQREQLRDVGSIHSNGSDGQRRSPRVEKLPREIIDPTSEGEYGEKAVRSTSAGIGGPSFLGLNYESSGNGGFVYDKPRRDGFVYDTDADTPQYLLEEIPRGVSWRAWALCLLLIAGGGLGYIQWRASHHQGPDLASILARNGPTVDPGGPTLPAKPADKTNNAVNNNSDEASAKDSSQTPENKDASPAQNDNAGEDSAVIDASGSSAKPDDSGSKNAKASKSDEASSEENNSGNSGARAGRAAIAKTAASENAEDNDSAVKPESDGPVAKTTKAGKAEVADEEPPQPKTLGDKDPLILQADKYIQGRGVRKNCSTGINLLRQAVSEGNPAASVKLGALYWSGTCVTQSKVTAYRWFSRAHSLEPNNRWVERSRNSLWASMSREEQRKSSY